MKALKTVAKILTAVAAVAGIVFVIVKYGDVIVAWVRNMCARVEEWLGLNDCCCCDEDCCCDEECCCGEDCCCEETPAEETVATEGDFEN